MKSKEPYLVITSDTHVSCPDGRWAHATSHFKAFLSSLQTDPPEIFFVNGDIIDNIVLEKGKPVIGAMKHWENDVRAYCSAIEPYKDIEFRGSLGPSHDFGGDGDIRKSHAGEKLCRPRGTFTWQGFDFVWLSGQVHSFSNDPELREESFDADDLLWLDKELATKRRAILMFHVPLTTEETIKHGAWPGNRSTNIPKEDTIYSVIDRHLDSIKMIFNGHMHNLIESEYKGIPLKIAPFYNEGHYCKVSVHDEELRVSVHTYPLTDS